jgi:hypothetical protein
MQREAGGGGLRGNLYILVLWSKHRSIIVQFWKKFKEADLTSPPLSFCRLMLPTEPYGSGNVLTLLERGSPPEQ